MSKFDRILVKLIENILPELKGMFESQMKYPYGLDKFVEPSLKGKFKLGDKVRVIDPQVRWEKYQSNKSKEALNKIGEIVGYRFVAGAYSKYAVKLGNGNIYGIHSHLLRSLTDMEIKIGEVEDCLPELRGLFEDARAHSGPNVLFQNVYATFDKIKDESLLNEFEKCLTELKTTLEKHEGVGRANLANCECEIQKNKNEFTFIVKRVPFTKIEADPKQKHHSENNLNHKFWECLWFIMNNKNNNNSKRDWLRAHLSINKYQWKNSMLDEVEDILPELKGMF